eukprot:3419871-Rhodomonas_salina.2
MPSFRSESASVYGSSASVFSSTASVYGSTAPVYRGIVAARGALTRRGRAAKRGRGWHVPGDPPRNQRARCRVRVQKERKGPLQTLTCCCARPGAARAGAEEAGGGSRGRSDGAADVSTAGQQARGSVSRRKRLAGGTVVCRVVRTGSAMPGTERVYAATRRWRESHGCGSGRVAWLRPIAWYETPPPPYAFPMRLPVLKQHSLTVLVVSLLPEVLIPISLRACYAMSGTELAYLGCCISGEIKCEKSFSWYNSTAIVFFLHLISPCAARARTDCSTLGSSSLWSRDPLSAYAMSGSDIAYGGLHSGRIQRRYGPTCSLRNLGTDVAYAATRSGELTQAVTVLGEARELAEAQVLPRLVAPYGPHSSRPVSIYASLTTPYDPRTNCPCNPLLAARAIRELAEAKRVPPPMVLRIPYEIPGTDSVVPPFYGPTYSLRNIQYCQPSTARALAGMVVHIRYAMPGTNLLYPLPGTRARGGRVERVASYLWCYAGAMRCPVLTSGMLLPACKRRRLNKYGAAKSNTFAVRTVLQTQFSAFNLAISAHICASLKHARTRPFPSSSSKFTAQPLAFSAQPV